MMGIVFTWIATPIGLLLGVLGFFRAGAAQREIWALRRDIHALTARLDDGVGKTAPAPAEVRPETPAPAPADNSVDIETMLTARWGVWLGSTALLLAGVFLIRFGVEQNLLGPATRCAMAALLGIGLVGAGEFLFRQSTGLPRYADQTPAGLAAGGVASLFGAAYGAGPFYDLWPLAPAFAAMVLCSAAGLLASLRYGPLVAAIGIAGGFVSPALVANLSPSLPGLFLYLTVMSAVALWIVRRTAWVWLDWCTSVAGGIWVCVVALQGGAGIWAAAGFVPVAASLHIFMLPLAALSHRFGTRLSALPFAAIASAGLLLEIETPGLAPRLALLALSPIAVWRGVTRPRLDRMSWIAALFGLLALAFWAIASAPPIVTPDELGQVFYAMLLDAQAEVAVQQFLITSALFALFHAASGLVLERRAANPAHWAALAAAVPVLTLAVAFVQVTHVQTSIAWSATGLALGLGLGIVAARATGRAIAGIYAAGAAAAIALGCAMLLHDQWLTLAIALLLPALAWIEAQADLPPLRQVALAIAAVVLIRLAVNWYVLDYVYGTMRLAGGLLVAYALPAISFAAAGVMFRRRADDPLVATLEAGACSLASAFVALEIRQGFGGEDIAGSLSFSEAALHLLTMAVQATAYLVIAERTNRAILRLVWRMLGGVTLALGVTLVLANPGLTNASAGPAALLIAYLVPSCLAAFAQSHLPPSPLRDVLGAYALVAGFVWVTLQVRQIFHPGALGLFDNAIDDAELWAWSGAWLVFGLGLMAFGVWASRRRLRLAALGVIGLVCVKVFLIDMSDLAGILRVLSFLGLGLGLIGLSLISRWLTPGPKRPG